MQILKYTVRHRKTATENFADKEHTRYVEKAIHPSNPVSTTARVPAAHADFEKLSSPITLTIRFRR